MRSFTVERMHWWSKNKPDNLIEEGTAQDMINSAQESCDAYNEIERLMDLAICTCGRTSKYRNEMNNLNDFSTAISTISSQITGQWWADEINPTLGEFKQMINLLCRENENELETLQTLLDLCEKKKEELDKVIGDAYEKLYNATVITEINDQCTDDNGNSIVFYEYDILTPQITT